MTLRRVLPGMLRLAVEAEARDRYFSEPLSRGKAQQEVDDIWTDTHKTAPRVSLAIYGEQKSLDSWLAKAGYRKRALGICTSAAHSILGLPLTGIPPSRT